MLLPFAGAEPIAQTRVIQVADASQVGEARRRVASLAAQLQLDESTAGRVAIVATELAGNVARHGKGGRLLVRTLNDNTGIEIIAIDVGPGMSDVRLAMRDGYSTAGTPGKGLGAIERMTDAFDLYSQPGHGTAMLARMLDLRQAATPTPARGGFEYGVVCVAAPGEVVSGDSWIILDGATGPSILVVDGLGHGTPAHEAAVAAIDAARRHPRRGPGELLMILHDALRHTRGAAAAVAELDESNGQLRFAGVGNISCSVTDGDGSHSLASINGIVGHEVRRVQEYTAPLGPGALFVMHSDGLQTRWRLDQYPGLRPRHPALAAAVLFRDFLRGRDDATVLVGGALRGARA